MTGLKLFRRTFACLFLGAAMHLWQMAVAQGPGYCVGFGGAHSLSGTTLPAYQVDNAFSVEAWVFPYSLSGTQSIAGNFDVPVQGFSFQLDASGNLGLQTSLGLTSNSGGLVTNSTWTHVAVTISGSTVTFFVNGEAAGTQTLSGSANSTSLPFYLGRQGLASAPQFFDGELDEVRIWDQALTQGQLRDWMCRKVNSGHPAYSNLSGYWRMDDGSGLISTDLSSNANHLTLNNNPMWGWSGAPLGDLSVHLTSSDLPNGAMRFNGDTLWIDQFNGAPQRVHAYLVTEAPNYTVSPWGFHQLDTTHYYGLFFVGGTNPSIDGRFAFGGSSFTNGTPACNVMVAVRPAANTQSWSSGTGLPDQANRRLDLQTYPRLEMIPGIRPHPHLVTSYPGDTACLGTTIDLTASGGAATYQWYAGSTQIPGANSSQYSANTAGSYHLVTTQNGCTYSSDTLYLHFNSQPQVIWGLQDTVCSDESNLILSGATPNGGTFSGTGVLGNQFDPVVAGAGTHVLTYTFTDSLGCTATANASIEVGTAPAATIGSFGPVCQLGDSVPLVSGTPAGGSYEGFGITGNSFYPNITGPGTWQIDYVATTPLGCDDTASTLIMVLPAPITPSISVAGGTLFSSSATGNQWYDLSGPVSGATGQVFSPITDGTYYVVVTDQNGCSSDSSNNVFVIANALDKAPNPTVKIWPQPASDVMNFGWQQEFAGIVPVYVFDGSGRVILQMELEATAGDQTFPVDVSGFPSGMYSVTIGGIGMFRFVVSK